MCPDIHLSFLFSSSLHLSPLVQSVSYFCKLLSILHFTSAGISVALESLYFWDCALFPFLQRSHKLPSWNLSFPPSWPNCFSFGFRCECVCGGGSASLGLLLSPFLCFIWDFLYPEFCYIKWFTLPLPFLAYSRKSFNVFLLPTYPVLFHSSLWLSLKITLLKI